MFVLPNDIARKVILGELDYNKLPYDADNEGRKGWRLQDQARVNVSLEGFHKPICSALEEKCKKQECLLYLDVPTQDETCQLRALGIELQSEFNYFGYVKGGWACKEFQVDFPTAHFDLRYHVSYVGIDKIDRKESFKRLEDWASHWARYICLDCYIPYHQKPEHHYKIRNTEEEGYIEMCRCGSSYFEDIKQFIHDLKKTL
jgi:hypothetical protein